MDIVCNYCTPPHKIGEKDGEGTTGTTHGICKRRFNDQMAFMGNPKRYDDFKEEVENDERSC